MPKYPLTKKKNKLLLADEGYQETEKILAEIIAELESVYGQAYEELKEKAEDYLEWFVEMDEAKREQFDQGKITAEEYQQWRRTKMLTGQNSYAMMQSMSDNLTNVNGVAASVINGYMPEVYATNGNYTTYTIEKNLEINTMFTLYDEQTIERLVRDKPELLPKAKVNIPKDQRWNKEQLNSAVMQGILQGETVDQIAQRLAAVSDMNQKSAVRNAVTMTTSAQNGGRMDGYRRAQSMGVKGLKHRWLATLDGHTRKSHRRVDGEVVKIGEEFTNGLEYPGDPNGDPREVYNCRCTTIAAFDDSEFDGAQGRNQHIFEKNSKVRNMSYESWKESKGGEPLFRSARNVNRDMLMHEEYKNLLGNKIPARFKDFQEIKYGDPDLWSDLISQARKERNRRRKNAGQ